MPLCNAYTSFRSNKIKPSETFLLTYLWVTRGDYKGLKYNRPLAFGINDLAKCSHFWMDKGVNNGSEAGSAPGYD
jgi:hypothetical protein